MLYFTSYMSILSNAASVPIFTTTVLTKFFVTRTEACVYLRVLAIDWEILHHFCWFQSVSTKNRIFFCGQVCWSFQLRTQQVLLSLNTTQYLKFVSQSTMSRTSFCLTLSLSITKLLEPTFLSWNVTWAKHLENAVQIMRTVSAWRKKLGIISTDWRKFLTTKTVESGPSLCLDKDCPLKEP